MRSVLFSVLTTLLVALPATAIGQVTTMPSPPPPICSGAGNLTITGHVPKGGSGASTALRIGKTSTTVNLFVNDSVKSVQQLAPVSQHLNGADDYIRAVRAMPAPTGNFSTVAQLAAYQEQSLQSAQAVANAQTQLQFITVDPSGNFTCRGIAAGSYTLFAQVVQSIKPKSAAEQRLWGPQHPNQLLERMTFRVGTFKKPTSVKLPANFSTLATFGL